MNNLNILFSVDHIMTFHNKASNQLYHFIREAMILGYNNTTHITDITDITGPAIVTATSTAPHTDLTQF